MSEDLGDIVWTAEALLAQRLGRLDAFTSHRESASPHRAHSWSCLARAVLKRRGSRIDLKGRRLPRRRCLAWCAFASWMQRPADNHTKTLKYVVHCTSSLLAAAALAQAFDEVIGSRGARRCAHALLAVAVRRRTCWQTTSVLLARFGTLWRGP
mmetsp:Transcript_79907/g.222276  ORF Transcript_79907/g.222276 Transcript_79907/m.222276 type:complete len:154 (+) Transcript_79907:736-1197(+)